MSLFQIILPEIILVSTACVLFLTGFLGTRGTGRLAASIGLVGLVLALLTCVHQYRWSPAGAAYADTYQNFRVSDFGLFIRVVCLSVGTLLLLLSWPFGARSEGNASVHYGRDAGEYFGLMLLAFTGLILVPSANDLMVLFMAIELASIPTYILVSISRPISIAQEAGVKYFFLGAMAAAVMLMGFAYLYGTTGTTNLHEIGQHFAANTLSMSATPWQLLAGVLIVVGICFKLAAVPMHAYVADVYQGAATPVTALIGFVPKTTGIVALIKILALYAGPHGEWRSEPHLAKLVWAIAVLTMTAGNLLALQQHNVKRMLAYSSVAHSGYLLAGLAVMMMGGPVEGAGALKAVIFYLAMYGLTSTAAFGALMLLPSRQSMMVGAKEYAMPATTAETLDDLAGVGRTRPIAGLLLAMAAFSLVGLPLTGGFWSKYYLIAPVFSHFDQTTPHAGWLMTLAIFILVNSAISAAYYLSIVGALFNRSEVDAPVPSARRIPLVATLSIVVSVMAVIYFGVAIAGTKTLIDRAGTAAETLDAGPMDALTTSAP